MQSLKTSLDSMFRRFGIDKAISQNNALSVWQEVVGEAVAKNTVADRVEHGILIVKVSSPTWRQELFFQKDVIVKKLNNKIGKNVIRDIRFI
jgi:predicted nucleic acid-binding Zn ribbon protein